MTANPLPRAAPAMSRVGRSASWRASSRSTASASAVIRGHQHRQGLGIVFGLGQEVRRHHLGVGGRVGENHEFGRARQHVDADIARHQLSWPR